MDPDNRQTLGVHIVSGEIQKHTRSVTLTVRDPHSKDVVPPTGRFTLGIFPNVPDGNAKLAPLIVTPQANYLFANGSFLIEKRDLTLSLDSFLIPDLNPVVLGDNFAFESDDSQVCGLSRDGRLGVSCRHCRASGTGLFGLLIRGDVSEDPVTYTTDLFWNASIDYLLDLEVARSGGADGGDFLSIWHTFPAVSVPGVLDDVSLESQLNASLPEVNANIQNASILKGSSMGDEYLFRLHQPKTGNLSLYHPPIKATTLAAYTRSTHPLFVHLNVSSGVVFHGYHYGHTLHHGYIRIHDVFRIDYNDGFVVGSPRMPRPPCEVSTYETSLFEYHVNGSVSSKVDRDLLRSPVELSNSCRW